MSVGDTPLGLWQQAVAARRKGDLSAARAHLDAALALDPGQGCLQPWLMQGDMLRDAGQLEEAASVFTRLSKAHDTNFWPHFRLAQIARQTGLPTTALARFEAALERAPERKNLQMGRAQVLLDLQRFPEAISQLNEMRTAHGPEAQILLALRRAYIGIKDTEQAESCLEELIDSNPLDPALLRHLFTGRANRVSEQALQDILAEIRRQSGEDLANELEVQARLRRLEFDVGLGLLTVPRRPRRDAAEAHVLQRTLFGAHRYRLHARYLRRCLRRWPDNQPLWSAYIDYAMRLGQLEAAAAAIESCEGSFPEHVIEAHRFRLCGYRGDLAGAAQAYERLKALGKLGAEHRKLIAQLRFNLGDLQTVARVPSGFEPEEGVQRQPLHRAGLSGVMTLELDLEQMEQPEGGYATEEDWMRARPSSSVPAIRLIDAWCSEHVSKATDAPPGARIPAQIVQYWHSTDIPPSIRRMTNSWAQAKGFAHRLMNRQAGMAYLREHFEPKWLQAFRLARTAAQEADLLRLCVLAREGGIYADADDHLYGDLNQVLGAGRGLVVYRETLGGAIGNNFLAAPPEHPVIRHAASIACAALLERSVEISWTKTGPGVLTRAMGQYLLETESNKAKNEVRVLDWPEIAGVVSTHNPVLYKTLPEYWGNESTRDSERDVWRRLHTALTGPT